MKNIFAFLLCLSISGVVEARTFKVKGKVDVVGAIDWGLFSWQTGPENDWKLQIIDGKTDEVLFEQKNNSSTNRSPKIEFSTLITDPNSDSFSIKVRLVEEDMFYSDVADLVSLSMSKKEEYVSFHFIGGKRLIEIYSVKDIDSSFYEVTSNDEATQTQIQTRTTEVKETLRKVFDSNPVIPVSVEIEAID